MDIFNNFLSKLPGSLNSFGPNFQKLVKFFANELSSIQSLYTEIAEYRNIDKASGKLLDDIGKRLNEPRGQGSDDFYRIMLKSKLAARRGDTTVNGILTTIKNFLGKDVQGVRVVPVKDEPQAIEITNIPLELATTDWEQQYLLKRIEAATAADIRVKDIQFINYTGETVSVVAGTKSAIIVKRGEDN